MKNLFAEVRVLAVLRRVMTEVIKHLPLHGEGRSNFDMQLVAELCTDVSESALF